MMCRNACVAAKNCEATHTCLGKLNLVSLKTILQGEIAGNMVSKARRARSLETTIPLLLPSNERSSRNGDEP